MVIVQATDFELTTSDRFQRKQKFIGNSILSCKPGFTLLSCGLSNVGEFEKLLGASGAAAELITRHIQGFVDP